MSASLAGPMQAKDRLVVLSRDPSVIAAAQDAAHRVRRGASVVASGREALDLLAAPGRGVPQLVCDPAAADAESWRDLLALAAEAGAMQATAPVLLVSRRPAALPLPDGMVALPPDGARLAAALEAPRRLTTAGRAAHGAAALRRGIAQGEIAVRYQPMIRLSDHRPMLVEALARWERAYPPVPPDRFVPLATREGLMQRLSAAVLRRAAAELAPLRRAAGRCPTALGLSVNLPLDLLLSPDLPGVLRRALGRSGLPPGALVLELTETHRVEDRALLQRALNRLRRAGHSVLLDDILPDDPRARLFDLPFAGLKLDRRLVAALPRDARLRHALRRTTRGAAARGQVVVAEGVSSPASMALLADLGVHWAQGFVIGRPLPASALPGWSARWRARGPG